MNNDLIKDSIPTRQFILAEFMRLVSRGCDSKEQFLFAASKWHRCGYPLAELPLVFKCTDADLQEATAYALADAQMVSA